MYSGTLKKMTVSLGEKVNYTLVLNEPVEMNALIGARLQFDWNGQIICSTCGKNTNKSFGDGFCYPCFASAPDAAECIIRPELCRAHLGEGRDPDWEEKHHNVPHIVYLAATDAVKVGVTRATQVPTRWIDQGAAQAIILAETPNRYEAGMLEVALKDFFTDKTNWQRMLKNETDDTIDLVDEKWRLHDELPSDLTTYFSEDDDVLLLNYPVEMYPEKVKSIGFDKTPSFNAVLKGIRGQYLIFEGGMVLNIRKHTGYTVQLTLAE